MSQSNQAKTKKSSQIPKSRAAPAGTEGSGIQNNQSDDQDNNQISSEAVSSRERSSYQQQQQQQQQQSRSRGKSNAEGPPELDPDDSISRMQSQPGRPTQNSNSDRRGSQKSRTPWNSWASQATRASDQNGTAWSGSGAALTENNLEKLNEASQNPDSGFSGDQPPRSDEQEVPPSGRQSSRQNGNATSYRSSQTNGAQRQSQAQAQQSQNGNITNYRGAQTNGTQRQSQAQAQQSQAQYTSRRPGGIQNQRYSKAEKQSSQRGQIEGGGNSKSGAAGAAGAAAAGEAAEAASYSQSRRQSVTASRNAIDANSARPRSASQSQNSAATASKNTSDNNGAPSRSKSTRSRRDSKFEDEGYNYRQTNQSQNNQLSRISSKPRSPQSSPTSPTSPNIPWGWERKTRIITKRYPDGREIREREVTVQPIDTIA